MATGDEFLSLLKLFGKMMGEVQNIYIIVDKVGKVLDADLQELTAAEAALHTRKSTVLAEAMRQCNSRGASCMRQCQRALDEWKALKQQQQSSQIQARDLQRQIAELSRLCVQIIEDFKQYKESLGTALTEATGLLEQCKKTLNAAESNQCTMRLMTAIGVVMALIGGGAAGGVFAYSGLTLLRASAAGLFFTAGGAVTYAAYNRLDRVSRIIDNLSKHRDTLDVQIKELNAAADKMEERQVLVRDIARALEEAERQQQLEEQEQRQLEKM